jgi:AcrR family transcriptional regulator
MPLARIARRARSQEAKAERRNQLLQAAREALAEASLDEVTLAGIAERAGLVKAATYRYFETKETLLLELLRTELEEWFEELVERLERPHKKPAEATAQILAETFCARPTLRALLPPLYGAIERNVGERDLQRFKHEILGLMATPAAALEAKLPGLEPGDGLRLLLHTQALIVGLGQMASPPAVLERLFESDPALRPFRVDLERELSTAVGALIRGYRAR